MEITGRWFDGRQSRTVDARMRVHDGGPVEVVDAGGTRLWRGLVSDVIISTRLGNTPRYLDLPDGSRFETPDNAMVDQMVARHAPARHSVWLHRLESHLALVVTGFLVVVALGYLVVRFGAPAIAGWGAQYVPAKVVAITSEQTLQALDRALFEPSELQQERQASVMEHFAPVLAEYPELAPKVLFRDANGMPNAFALPDGTIVFTDAMVTMAEDPNELVAVLAHEIGHVYHRHAMRRMIQDSLLGFLAAILIGDASGISEIFLGLPVLLAELAYSREFEREADQFALAYMAQKRIPGYHFTRLMERIDRAHRCGDDQPECPPDEGKVSGYFSTHPPTRERVEAFGH